MALPRMIKRIMLSFQGTEIGGQINGMTNTPADGSPLHGLKPPTARVFFALWPSVELAEQLGRVAREAAARFGGRATRPDSIHLTLAFLGNVPEARLPELAVTAASVQAAAFAVTIDCLDYWVHNHLLWAGCSVPVPRLVTLATALRGAMSAAGFKVGRTDGKFSAHVSLVRRVPEGAVVPGTCPLPIGAFVWPCSRFVLVRSQLTASGSEYRIIQQFPLSGESLG